MHDIFHVTDVLMEYKQLIIEIAYHNYKRIMRYFHFTFFLHISHLHFGRNNNLYFLQGETYNMHAEISLFANGNFNWIKLKLFWISIKKHPVIVNRSNGKICKKCVEFSVFLQTFNIFLSFQSFKHWCDITFSLVDNVWICCFWSIKQINIV